MKRIAGGWKSVLDWPLVYGRLLFFSILLLFCSKVLASGNNSISEFRLIGDIQPRIAPGEAIKIRVSVTAEGTGKLAVRISDVDRPPFVSELRKSVNCSYSCQINEDITLAPSADDCGKYKFRVVADFTSGGSTIWQHRTIIATVIPRIEHEPPFSPDNFNELLWTPCTAHVHELFFSQDTTSSQQEMARLSKQVSTALERQVVENLSHATRYGYWVEATVANNGGFTPLFSDTAFSTQDDSPPPAVALHDFTVDEKANVTLRWPVLPDDVSFLDHYTISRRQLTPTTGPFEEVVTLPFFPVSDISLRNYFPANPKVDHKFYVDRGDSILSLPGELLGSAMIKTAYGDRWSIVADFLTFELKATSHVYVAIDKDIKPKPDWLKDAFESTFDLKTTAGKLRVFRSKTPFPAGTVTLGGNFAGGTGINHSEPHMYALFVKPVSEVFPFLASDLVSFTDALGDSSDLKSFQYKVNAVDAVGNIADGVVSSPIIMDLHGHCKPLITDYFVFDNGAGGKFGRDSTNTVCVEDPDVDLSCALFRESDSLRFQAVRDSLKFFDFHLPEDEGLRFFDSGWLPVESLCHTFTFGSENGDPNFVNGHEYFYRVRAKDFQGNLSAWSDTVSAVQDVFPPGDIQNLACDVEIFATCTDGVIKVDWDEAVDNASGVASYQVYRRLEGEPFKLIGEVDQTVTMFPDTLSKIGVPKIVHYKIGSTDNLGHVRGIAESNQEIWKRAPIGPKLVPDSTDVVDCPGFKGTNRDTLRVIFDGDDTDVLKYRVTVKGPSSVRELLIRDTSVDTLAILLNEGDGDYWITARAEYLNIISTCSDSLHITKRKQSPQPVENLMAVQDSLPTGNIILKWTHPDPSLVSQFRVFVWPEGETMPSEPDTIIVPPDSMVEIRGLPAYECNLFKVQVLDCFGNLSEDNPVVTQYSNRPPKFDSAKTIIEGNSITVFWTRPSPRLQEAINFDATVLIYQDSVTSNPDTIKTVFNKTQVTCELPSMHNYIFRMKETILDDLNQACADTFMSGFSKPITVPLDNLPDSVDFGLQALPVHPDSANGRVFVSWQGYMDAAVEQFVVKWSNGKSDSMRVADDDTLLVFGLDTSDTYEFMVIAIDSLEQRSKPTLPKSVNFKPLWQFTPKIQDFISPQFHDISPACFRDAVTVTWDWVNEKCDVVDTTFGAVSVEIEISIDPAFAFKTSRISLPIMRQYTFDREMQYPFINSQNSLLYARIRGKDQFGHTSPWSMEYEKLRSDPGKFDDVAPPVITCLIDSITAPGIRGSEIVDVLITWPDVSDTCSGTWFYEVTLDDSVVHRDTSRVPLHKFTNKDVPADSSLIDREWRVHAVDSLSNRQEVANGCSVEVFLNPPTVTTFTPEDTTVCWTKDNSGLPVTYMGQFADDPILFGTGDDDTCATQDTCCKLTILWRPLYGRVKTMFGPFESGWSKIEVFSDHSAISDLETPNQDDLLPTDYSLSQNYPNPFNPTTTISYTIPELEKRSVEVVLEIYNVLGQHIRTLVDETQASGFYSAVWDGKNEIGQSSGSGIYVYRLRAGGFQEVRKMTLLK